LLTEYEEKNNLTKKSENSFFFTGKETRIRAKERYSHVDSMIKYKQNGC